MSPEIVGWLSTGILIMTITPQVYTQWNERNTAGVSRWLFIGQITSSAGFILYSFLLENWVFILSNIFMLAIAIVGQYLLSSNRKREELSH